MTRPDLARAIEAAYETRIRHDPLLFEIDFDPFRLFAAGDPKIRLLTYARFCKGDRERMAYLLSNSTDGLTLLDKQGRRLVLYNDARGISKGRKRFTLAHEYGHYVLGHRDETEAEEAEADCFARNLLAPLLLARYHKIGFGRYPKEFRISQAAAYMCERYESLDATAPKRFEDYIHSRLDLFPADYFGK